MFLAGKFFANKRTRNVVKFLVMATKYDTNPLDPDFPEKAKAAAEGQATQGLPYAGTQAFPYVAPTAMTEEQTRRFAATEMPGFHDPYNGQYVPAQYPATGLVAADNLPSRKVARVGLSENILTALPYIPWYIGMVASVLILLLVPRSEAKVRFHASQGLAAHIGILIVTTILGVIGNITDFARIGNFIFLLVTTIMLIVFAIKAWQAKPIHIESVEDLTNWLDEKISPKLS